MTRRTRISPLCLSLLLLVGASIAVDARAQSCPSLVWADEFDGASLDTGKWSYQTGDGCTEGICGWGNNELQSYQEANVTVQGGTLRITAREQRVRGKNYTSGRIRTLGKGEWTTGRIEARLKLPTGQGIWPAFWMLPSDEVYGGWPASGEIDIMEHVGHEISRVHGTIHYGESFQAHQQSGTSYDLHEGVFADGFHVFAIEKEPGLIRWLVDDVVYFTATSGSIAPAHWPFDERFHLLMNLAVGGNWPGNPDASTVFPQTLEADYVRVYDGNFPSVTGDRKVPNQAGGIVYSVANAPAGSSFSWSVPAGATLVSGQGTNAVTVDWGTTGGAVTVDVASDCGNRQLSIDVEVEPAFVFDFSFENFDDPANLTLNLATGTLTEVQNPSPSAVNSSAMSGEYARSAAEQYDVMAYAVTAIPDASAYATNGRKLKIDVLTSAPVGSVVLLQLEDASLATSSNYPSGRHSRYQAVTTVQNQWERLTLDFLDSPDPGTPNNGIDNLILLFAPNTFTGDVYTFDNLDSYVVDGGGTGGPGGEDPAAVHVATVVSGTEGAGKGKKRAVATVMVRDDLGDPVAGATVSGTFSGTFSESVSGATGADGTVTLKTTGTASGGVSVGFCVDGVSHPSLAYDPAANGATCG